LTRKVLLLLLIPYVALLVATVLTRSLWVDVVFWVATIALAYFGVRNRRSRSS